MYCSNHAALSSPTWSSSSPSSSSSSLLSSSPSSKGYSKIHYQQQIVQGLEIHLIRQLPNWNQCRDRNGHQWAQAHKFHYLHQGSWLIVATKSSTTSSKTSTQRATWPQSNTMWSVFICLYHCPYTVSMSICPSVRFPWTACLYIIYSLCSMYSYIHRFAVYSLSHFACLYTSVYHFCLCVHLSVAQGTAISNSCHSLGLPKFSG